MPKISLNNSEKAISCFVVGLIVLAFSFLHGACDFTEPEVKAPPKPLPRQEKIVARVNGRQITQRELDDYLQRVRKIPPPKEPIQLKNLRREYLLRLIERILFLKEAEKKGITVNDEAVLSNLGKIMGEYPEDYLKSKPFAKMEDDTWKEESRTQLIIKKLIRQEVHDKIKISKKNLEDYYKSHKEEFDREEMVRIRQIMVSTEKKANEVRKKLLARYSFIKMIRKYSQSPDKEKDGDLGFFARGRMPVEFDDAAFSLKKINQVSQVFRSDYGYHIFQLVAKRRAKKLKFIEVKDKIRKILREEREKGEFRRWFSRLKKQADITINNSFL